KMAKKKNQKKKKIMKSIKSRAKPIKKLIAPLYKKPKSSEANFFIAVLIVLIILFFASSFYNNYKINSEAEKIIDSLVIGDEVDEQALNRFMSKDYDELKKELGITKDFIVHFEDENENPIEINGMYGFGYEK
ncbi:MAG: hypothetical protein KKF74_03915, partial [Nanoarchaeota archaeon]|nr:hypothetical protein [Nanoarchaeota archaeon]